MKKKIIDLEIIDDLEQSGVAEIALVDVPAIEKYWMAFRDEAFVKPSAGESEEEFLNRCIPAMLEEGKEQDQAVAMCYSMYENMSYDTGALPVYVDEIPDKKRKFAEEYSTIEEAVERSKELGLKGEIHSHATEDGFIYMPGASHADLEEALEEREEFQETFTDYPDAAVENAKRALAYAEENGWGDCGTPIGKQRANQLANREGISEDTVARMAAFERHRQNSTTPYGEGCGKLMWDAWGGDEGIAWAQRKIKGLRNLDLSKALDYFRALEGIKEEDFDFNGMAFEKDHEGIDMEFAAGYTVYRYEGDVSADTRDFCAEMVADGRFFTFEEIVGFNSDNPGFGPGGSDEYSIFHYKGGPNCKHHWQKYYVNAKGVRENKGPAPGKAGTEPYDMPNQGYMMAAERPIARIPEKERGREGSTKNEPGDTKTSRGGIEVSQEVEKTLKDKVEEHNKKNPQDSQKADLGMLKAVWRRGAGAYSVGTPGRRGMTRSQWAMGRVNAFLRILSGSSPSDKDYTQDNDLLPKGHPKHSEEKMRKLMFASEDQQIVVGPVAIPDMEIIRKDDDGNPYYVRFSKDVVQRMAEKFMKELRNKETNIQHNSEDRAGSYVMETWIVEHPQDKANSIYDLDVPVGSWVVSMRVEDPATWKKIKAGELRGFSLEGNFMDRKDWEQYQKDREVYNKIIRILKSS